MKTKRLKGVLDFSLGNFLCLRGFAPMGLLYDLSEPDPSIQRNLLSEHRDEMVAFLSEGEFLFFPEVILGTTLCRDAETNESVNKLYESVRNGQRFSKLRFDELQISSTVSTASGEDRRSVTWFNAATIFLNKFRKYKFSRIDGNHRLSATPEDPKFRKHNTPFCLIFFRNTEETKRFSRALFHNINYKQVPLTMEQNLKLILDDPEKLFLDEKLKTHESFGWPYYHARKLHNALDFDVFANLKPFIEKEPRTFLVNQFTFLIQHGVLGDNENALSRFKTALVKVNGLFDAHPALKESKNRGLLAALVYYELDKKSPVTSFVRWILENHLHLIKESSSADLIAIFNKVLTRRKRTIFVSMPFGKDKPNDHYAIIERVAKEVSEADPVLNPPLKVQRVDWFHDGTSYEINDKIIEMMSDCGLLIGNLTHCNPNVYHEVGFIMGKAKAEGKDVANMLLFLDESVADDKDKFVGFNLRGIKQLRFTQAEVQFAPALKENLERFFKVKA